MHSKSILLSIGVLSIARIVAADQPFTSHSLAVLESSVAFCGRTDPAAAGQYQDKAKHYAAGMSEQKLTDARNSTEYKEAFIAASAAFKGLSKDQAVSTCASLLKGGK